MPRFDRFMVSNDIGRDLVLRNRFTVAERWCWVSGVLATAAESPIRGWLFLSEKVPAETADIADAAGVPAKVGRTTIEKAKEFGLVVFDEDVRCNWLPDFESYNPAPKYDKTNARRQALFRDSGLREEIRDRDDGLCRYCGIEVNWSDRRGTKGGTYDHLDPEGPNTPENLVVACRGCNSRKGSRTPAAAGLVLLPEPSSDLDQTQVGPTRSRREVEEKRSRRTTRGGPSSGSEGSGRRAAA